VCLETESGLQEELDEGSTVRGGFLKQAGKGS
jgi:hypothetical protein